LDYPDFEILIMPDFPFDESYLKDGGSHGSATIPIRAIPTGKVNPARKRDIALKQAKGELLAFLDDDAYPDKDWLKNALKNFTDNKVAAVGGPAVTPSNDSLRQKISGAIYASILVSGNFRYRYIPGKRMEVVDFPSCNFIVRKSVMDELGGFNTDFWPGEDTKLCRDIVKASKLIIYDPKVLVYHHRRKAFLPHLKQIANYATHRGYFVKKYPETSFKFSYFLPSFFLLGVILGALLIQFIPLLEWVYFTIIWLYLFLVFIFSVSNDLGIKNRLNLSGKALLITGVFIGIILTHVCYGFYFIKGLILPKLAEEALQ